MARKLTLATTLLAASATFAFAAPSSASAGVLSDLNQLLAGTVGTVVDTSGALVGNVDPTGGVITDATGQIIATVDGTTGQIFGVSGQLLGTVDGVTGVVTDPLGNVLGGVLPSGQTGSPGSGSPGPPQVPTQTGGGGGQAGGLALSLSASRTQRLSTVARRGVTARTACSGACGVLSAVTIDGRTARRLRLGNGVRPVVIGTTARASAGALPIRLTTRARRALAAALPSVRTRRMVRSRKNNALRQYRAQGGAAKRSALRRYDRYRSQERRFLGGRVKLTITAVAVDTRGRTSTTRRLGLIVKR